jgi:acyl carrier protein
MNNTLTIEELQILGREVTGNSNMALRENLSANEVLGWDSLNHTLIMMELSARYQIEIDPEQTACYRTFGELVTQINKMFGR